MARAAKAVTICIVLVVLCEAKRKTSPKKGEPQQNATKDNQGYSNTGKQVGRHPIAISPAKTADEKADDEHGTHNQNVSIVTPKESVDYIERIITVIGVICTVALTIVGIIGICVALRTVKTIQRQSLIMIRQARIFQRQANSMERQ